MGMSQMGIARAFQFFDLRTHARDDCYNSHQDAGMVGAEAVLFQIFGAECVGFGGGQDQVE